VDLGAIGLEAFSPRSAVSAVVGDAFLPPAVAPQDKTLSGPVGRNRSAELLVQCGNLFSCGVDGESLTLSTVNRCS
jgi:hypothetical protein